jgi:hypothetical protein
VVGCENVSARKKREAKMNAWTGAGIGLCILTIGEIMRGGPVHTLVSHMYTFAALAFLILGMIEKRKTRGK